MNALLCRRCHGKLPRPGGVHGMHFTSSPNHFTMSSPGLNFPFPFPTNDLVPLGLAPGSGLWPYAPLDTPMIGTSPGLSWIPMAGPGLLPPFSYPHPAPFPDLGEDLSSLSLGVDQGLFSQPETVENQLFLPMDEAVLGPQPSDIVQAGLASSASPSIFSVPSPIPDTYPQMDPAIPPVDTTPLYRCSEPGCKKAFKKACSLKQHERTHTRPEVCRHCVRDDGTPVRFADKKGLRRHMVAKHAAMLEEGTSGAAVGSRERRACPFPGCRYEQREDNVSRHHQRVHGVAIRWKRGVAYESEVGFGNF